MQALQQRFLLLFLASLVSWGLFTWLFLDPRQGDIKHGSLLEREDGVIFNHIYKNESSRINRPRAFITKCAVYEDAQEWLGASEPSQYPWRPAVRSNRRSQILYGTRWAQQVIWDHQHPKSCHGKKYLAMGRMPASGMGSQIHVLGQILAMAIQSGRIFVFHEDSPDQWYDSSVCPGSKSWECWFLPVSSCTPPPKSPDIQEVDINEVFMSKDRHNVPDVFHDCLQCSPVKVRDWFYWWRAQATAYIVRFNQRTRFLIDEMRSKLLYVADGATDQLYRNALPAGTISSHVRHGDKGIEADVFSFRDYAHEFERLASGDQTIPVLYAEVADSNNTFIFPEKRFAGRSLFISTEDQAVIDQAKEFIRGKQLWTLYYCNVDRPNVAVGLQLRMKGARTEVLEAFVNLELALEADGFVCTLSSNWCRLIDELRMTVGGKISAPYISISRGGNCYGPLDAPCRQGIRRSVPCSKDNLECYLDW